PTRVSQGGPQTVTIRRKLALGLLASVIPLIVLGLVAVNIARGALRREIRQGLANAAGLEAERVNRQLDSTDLRLEVLAGPAGLGGAVAQRLPSPELAEALVNARADMAGLRAAAVYDLDYRRVADTARLGSVTSVPTSFVARAALRPVTGRAFVAAPDGDARYHKGLPLVGPEGRTVGVLVVECSLAPIAEMVEAQNRQEAAVEAHLVQLQEDGDAEFLTELRYRPHSTFSFVVPADRPDALAQRAARGESTLLEGARDYRGVQVVAATRPIPATGWGLVMKIDQREAFAPVEDLMQTLFLAVAAAAGAALVSSSLVLTPVSRRIRRVTSGALALSQGDLTTRVADHSRDELGVLAGAFDTMVQRLADDRARRRHMEQLLEHRALHDSLTELPNRTLFWARLDAALAVSRRQPGGGLYVLFCDLDEFKTVNDELGHSAGDELLRQVGRRIRDALAPSVLLARFGGDEFVALCTDVAGREEAEAVAVSLIDALEAPFDLVGRPVFVSVSIGLASDGPGATPESLIRDADTAMYRAKAKGKGRYALLDATTRAKASRRLTLATDLRQAIDHAELTLVYQPIVEFETGAVRSLEALLRWRHPTRGVLKPAEFLPVAEESGLSRLVDRWVIDQVCAQLADWRAPARPLRPLVAVNLSSALFSDSELFEEIVAPLERHDVAPQALCLEITEGALGGDPEAAVATLAALKALGVEVAIDDFGTGHSSLERLWRLPVDVIKMDQSFVRDIDTDPAARSIAGAIAGLGATLGLAVVAEGVERSSQYQTLWSLGCGSGQGWFFARPRPAPEAFAPLLAARVGARGEPGRGAS
ncbi:MAG: putative bifunctional diguanylate cyclase/phosphodiesterase, partial [Acidimicrobiales bacterium]